MGRVADALKKAQSERESRIRIGAGSVSLQAGSAVLAEDSNPRSIPLIDTYPKGHRASESRRETQGAMVDQDAAEPGNAGTSGRIGQLINSSEGSEQPAMAGSWDVHPTVVAVHSPSSTITEQYRAARTWLLRRYSRTRSNSIALTSAMPREGKSVTTANLAVVMAEVRHMKILAVDCDFRQGSLAKLFKLPNSPGLSDVLAGRASLESAIQATPLGNLFVLPGGSCRDNPTELLNSTNATRVFEEICEGFGYTLVDTPPVQCLSDVGVIGALCAGVVLVVRMNKTPAHLVRQSSHWLQANHLNVLGCIAADCSAKGARYEYDANHGD